MMTVSPSVNRRSSSSGDLLGLPPIHAGEELDALRATTARAAAGLS
jgi:hypothetical protein